MVYLGRSNHPIRKTLTRRWQKEGRMLHLLHIFSIMLLLSVNILSINPSFV